MGHIKERQEQLEPGRIIYAKKMLKEIGYIAEQVNERAIKFNYNGEPVVLYPYSGWFTGKTVKDGRGIYNLLRQITKWNLRNQDKIKDAFGEDILNRIRDSLNCFFSNVDDIKPWINISGIVGPYPTLSINDTGSENRMIHFYVISQEPVYRLTFIEFTK